jgi:hypothetical protein
MSDAHDHKKKQKYENHGLNPPHVRIASEMIPLGRLNRYRRTLLLKIYIGDELKLF